MPAPKNALQCSPSPLYASQSDTACAGHSCRPAPASKNLWRDAAVLPASVGVASVEAAFFSRRRATRFSSAVCALVLRTPMLYSDACVSSSSCRPSTCSSKGVPVQVRRRGGGGSGIGSARTREQAQNSLLHAQTKQTSKQPKQSNNQPKAHTHTCTPSSAAARARAGRCRCG